MNMVGQDLGSPPQNPVPNAYELDPFEGAQVQEGTGQVQTRSSLGFGRRPPQQAYLSDPFANAPRANNVQYTRPEDTTFSDSLQSTQIDSSGDPLNPPPPPPSAPEQPRLDALDTSQPIDGQITTENIPDVYSLTASELPQYGIDINAANVGTPPPDSGIVSGFNDPDGDGFDNDGHAMGPNGPVNVPTAQGEQSIQNILADPSAGLSTPSLTDRIEGYAQPQQRLNAAGEVVTTGPGAAISAALPPGLGAVAAIGGAISARNLDNIHREHGEYTEGTGLGYIGRDAVGAGTPLAVSPGFIPGTLVVSGNTDLAIRNNPALDVDGDGQLTATELQNSVTARREEQERRARQAELDRVAAEDRRLAEAARRAEAERERQRQAERDRQQRQAAERARQEAERRENQRRANEELERQRQRDRDNNRGQIQQGRAVTSARTGRAVRDSSGRIVTDRPSQRNDSGGGGGGGGDSCFAKHTPFLMADGTLKGIDEIKVGDVMAHGGRVYGIMQGDGTGETWYDYFGVKVTGSHFVLEGRWVPVEDSQYAQPLVTGYDTWYCVLNEKHRLVAFNDVIFTDFDAVDSVNDELEERLNGKY